MQKSLTFLTNLKVRKQITLYKYLIGLGCHQYRKQWKVLERKVRRFL